MTTEKLAAPDLSAVNSLFLPALDNDDLSEEGFFLNSKKDLSKEQKSLLNKKRKSSKPEKAKQVKAPTKHKTVCQYFLNGACKRGDSCVFLHDNKQRKGKEVRP